MNQIDLGLGLEGTHVLITGAGGLIGSRVVSAFLKADCRVSALDYDDRKLSALKTTIGADNRHLTCHVADISSEKSLNQGFHNARNAFGTIDCCVALASLDLSILDQHKSIIDLPFQQFKKTVDVNLSGTFLTAKLWLQQFVSAQSTNKNRSLIIIGSEVGQFGARGNADYASTKSAVQGGLLQSLKADIPRISPGARVNAVAPGPVDTVRFKDECGKNPGLLWEAAQATVAIGEPIPVAAVARSIIFLASENFSSHVHGQVLNVDGGKQGNLMWREGEMRANLEH